VASLAGRRRRGGPAPVVVGGSPEVAQLRPIDHAAHEQIHGCAINRRTGIAFVAPRLVSRAHSPPPFNIKTLAAERMPYTRYFNKKYLSSSSLPDTRQVELTIFNRERVNFIALDVETANPDMSSICQVGIVHFKDGEPVETWSTLVDPQDDFDYINISIHGIDEEKVRGAPTFDQISREINQRIEGQVVAIHTAFDRNAISQASARHKTVFPQCSWLNTASVARRTWPEVAQRGYGLAPLAAKLGIDFGHHDASEDARAAGLILVRAMTEMGMDLAGWLERVQRPIHGNSYRVAQEGNAEGLFHGEIVVFTGALTMPRHEAAKLAATAGCEIADGVTKHTTLLVVGDQDIRLLNGQEKSNKHRKAEDLITKGKLIRIITETDFLSMVVPR
jgi:DNA polymerase-3 subunit epsilon